MNVYRLPTVTSVKSLSQMTELTVPGTVFTPDSPPDKIKERRKSDSVCSRKSSQFSFFTLN